MTPTLPTIVKSAARFMAALEIAATRFPRAHRYIQQSRCDDLFSQQSSPQDMLCGTRWSGFFSRGN